MITVKDVALRAGVPLRMAERALSGTTQGKRRDARERAERIRKIAREMGYCPSEVALALKRGSTKTLGLLLPSLTDMFYAAASEIAMDEAAKYGYSIIIRLTRFQPGIAEESIRRFRSSRVEGILYGADGLDLDPKLMTLLEEQKFPFLTFGHANPNRFSAVIPDYSGPLRQAVGLLAERGHRRIALALLQRTPSEHQTYPETFLHLCAEYKVRGEIFSMDSVSQYRDLARKHREALLINGKYSMRAFLSGASADPGYQPDLIGFYNEWTWAQASAFRLQGVVMEKAELSIRTSVRAMMEQIKDRAVKVLKIPSGFYSRDQFSGIHVLDLANQYLGDEEC